MVTKELLFPLFHLLGSQDPQTDFTNATVQSKWELPHWMSITYAENYVKYLLFCDIPNSLSFLKISLMFRYYTTIWTHSEYMIYRKEKKKKIQFFTSNKSINI